MLSSTDGLGTQQVGLDESREDVFPFLPRTNTIVIFAAGIGGYSPPQILTSPSNDICCKEKGHGDRRRGRPLLRRRRCDGLAGEFDRPWPRFFDVFALGDGVFGSAAAFAAFLDALVLPLLLPENEVLLRLYFLGVVWLVVVIVTKFAGGLR